MRELQEAAYASKRTKSFDVTDVPFEVHDLRGG
jgi:hypothetical protein